MATPKPQYRFSCQPCKKRKTKCDRVDPCASCMLRKTAQFCYNGKGEPAYTQIDPLVAAIALKNAQRVPIPSSGSAAALPSFVAAAPAGKEGPADLQKIQSLPGQQGTSSFPSPDRSDQSSNSRAESALAGALPRGALTGASLQLGSAERQFPGQAGPSSNFQQFYLAEGDGIASTSPPATFLPPFDPATYAGAGQQIGNEEFAEGLPGKRRRAEGEEDDKQIRLEEAAEAQRIASLKSQLVSLRAAAANIEELIAASHTEQVGQVASRIDSTVLALEGESEAFWRGRIFDAMGSSYSTTLTVPELGWADISTGLPSQADCSKLLQYFLEELQYYSPIIHRRSLEQRWDELLAFRQVTRNEAALLILAFAITGLLVPRGAPLLQQCVVDPRDHHARWFKYAFQILEMGRDALSNEDNSFDRLLVDSLALAYTSYAGMHDLSFSITARGVRRAQCLHLFDDTHRAWNQLTDVQTEYRRRCAHNFLIVDRWQAFHFRRDFAIDPSRFNVEDPTYDTDECFDLAKGQRDPSRPPSAISRHSRRIEFGEYLLQVCRFFDDLPKLKPADRYERAERMDGLINQNLLTSLAGVGLTFDDITLPWSVAEPAGQLKRLAIAGMWYSSAYYVRCMIFRPFLEDEQAPDEVRFKALDHAKRLLDCVPLVLTLHDAPTVPFTAAWTSIHLLSASTTFAVPFLIPSAQSPADDSNNIKASPWPQQHLTYFSEKIFDTLSVLDIFDSHGNYAAKICRQLLFALCTSRSELQERFIRHRQSLFQSAAQEMASNHMLMGHLQDALVSTNTSGTPNRDPGFLPAPQAMSAHEPSFLDTLIMAPEEWHNLTAGLGVDFENIPELQQ